MRPHTPHTAPRTIPSLHHSRPPTPTLFPYTTLFRSDCSELADGSGAGHDHAVRLPALLQWNYRRPHQRHRSRSEEHTSELRHVEISYAVFCLKKKNH